MSKSPLNDSIHNEIAIHTAFLRESCDQRATAEAQCHSSCQVEPRGFAKSVSQAIIGVPAAPI